MFDIFAAYFSHPFASLVPLTFSPVGYLFTTTTPIPLFLVVP